MIKIPKDLPPPVKIEKDLGCGCKRIITKSGLSDFKYYRTILFSVWTCISHLLIGYVVLAALRPFIYIDRLRSKNEPDKYITDYYTVEYNRNLVHHVLYSTVGFQLIIAESIMSLMLYNGLSIAPVKPWHKKRIYWISLIIGSFMALTGIYSIYKYNGKFNYKTVHGFIGVAAGGFIFISILIGISASIIQSERRKALLKAIFMLFVYVAFVLSSISFIFGIRDVLYIKSSDRRFYFNYHYNTKYIMYACAVYTFGIVVIPIVFHYISLDD